MGIFSPFLFLCNVRVRVNAKVLVDSTWRFNSTGTVSLFWPTFREVLFLQIVDRLLFRHPLHFCMALQNQCSCILFCEFAVAVLLKSVNYVWLSEFSVIQNAQDKKKAEC